MTKLKGNKLFTLLLALSTVVIVAGIILYAVLGFNTAPDRLNGYRVNINYNVIIEIDQKQEELQKVCEDAFSANGVKFEKREELSVVDSATMNTSMDKTLIYTFGAKTSEEALAKAVAAINGAVGTGDLADAEVYARWHVLEGERFYDSAWRGAIAIAVAIVVALGYVAARYGLSCGVAGLACCVHDALFTAAFFALTRFPVYAFAPVLYSAVAALVSAVLWLIVAGKCKKGFKEGEKRGEEIVRGAVKDSKKTILFTAGIVAIAVALLGVGTVALALIGVAVPVFSSLFIGPEAAIAVRTAIEKRRDKKKGGYVGKKKAETPAE